MTKLRRSNERGVAEHGWLSSRHTFSFGSYFDPRHVGFKSLRVINEDRVRGGTGFGRHPHSDMEIISYVIEGGLKHEDSMGTSSVIRPGEVQRMSAGRGIEHAEFNASATDPVHFLQIWIRPNQVGGEPGYAQKSFAEELARGDLTLVASGDGRAGSISLLQDANLHLAKPKAGHQIDFYRRSGRGVWIQVITGIVTVAGERLEAGDAWSSDEGGPLEVRAEIDAEFMLFDLG